MRQNKKKKQEIKFLWGYSSLSMKNTAITLVPNDEMTSVNIKCEGTFWRQVDQAWGKNTDKGDSTSETNQKDDLTGKGACDKASYPAFKHLTLGIREELLPTSQFSPLHASFDKEGISKRA